ncbi:acetyltransferase [Emticicia sp. CRIBPO]|uniref:acetyltransferase n=1 Tax=Emticicia sp. CRIBPO TaxID=2683258 RepID=UPI001413121E|nr:acetyltransferase [Emticicia sp. CRIBPO]NBA88481.1 acetyltransferase [Emticicia sp. CRIBPO]
MKKIILIGGGGHCKSCIEVIHSQGLYEIAGILDGALVAGNVLGYPVIGDDDMIEALAADGHCFLITVGQIKNSGIRRKLFEKVKACYGEFAVVKASTAYVSEYASVGEGTILMHGVFVNAGVSIGVNGIINTKALVEHDVVIGNHCHISTGSIINGDCVVEDNCFIGSGAVIRQGIVIAEKTVAGAGAVVVRNTEYEGVYAGNPAVLMNK